MLSNYEIQYLNIIKDIMDNGYYDDNRTGIRTKKLPHKIIQVDLQKEFPILQTKFVAFKTAVKEMMWIYQKQSNIVQELRDMNVKVWNEWELEDGTIGHAYGYIVKKHKQIDKLIESLKNNPQDRRMMINLWDIEELPNMALQPCCFLTMWDVTDGKLNCMLVQRSGDMGLGVPFNTTQFAVLTHLIAQSTGLKVGTLTHVINNAHIYENQFAGIKEQLERAERCAGATSIEVEMESKILAGYTRDSVYLSRGLTEPEYLQVLPVLRTKPKLWINPTVTHFYDFKPEDIILEDYNHLGSIKMEVAV